MQEIIIGTQGNQPFKISTDGVSSKHAKLTITDDGHWILEDLNSTNGTFVYNTVKHCYERIAKKVISPTTKIRLGSDDTVRCYKFKALRLAKANGDDFSYEFRELKSEWEEVSRRKDKIKQLSYWTRYVPMVASIFALVRLPFIGDWDSDTRMNLMLVGIVLSSLITPIINLILLRRQESVNAEIKEKFTCPNPDCMRTTPLTEEEIKRGQCIVCKKHI